jgi:hypothetical protein
MELTTDECISALWHAGGNVTKAAELLRIDSARLRRIVHRFPAVKAEWLEIQEQLLDTAERNVREALNDTKNRNRQDRMAKFVLGRSGREWQPRNTTVNASPNGNLRLVWSDGERVGE